MALNMAQILPLPLCPGYTIRYDFNHVLLFNITIKRWRKHIYREYRPFPHSRLITEFVTKVTRRVTHME